MRKSHVCYYVAGDCIVRAHWVNQHTVMNTVYQSVDEVKSERTKAGNRIKNIYVYKLCDIWGILWVRKWYYGPCYRPCTIRLCALISNLTSRNTPMHPRPKTRKGSRQEKNLRRVPKIAKRIVVHVEKVYTMVSSSFLAVLGSIPLLPSRCRVLYTTS